MAPSLTAHTSFTRPKTSDRPVTRDNIDSNLIIPSRTSSLHSRITQPIPSSFGNKPQQRTPKTLTHAYMVCGVGREPSQWVKAPPPSQGKIGHMKGAVGQFWLPEILGSSPRLEQDNDIARSLHAAMRVCVAPFLCCAVLYCGSFPILDSIVLTHEHRHASPTMSRFALAGASLTAFTTLSSSSRTLHTHSTVFA